MSAGSTHPLPRRPGPRFWPATRLGKFAVALAIANLVLVPSWRLMGPLGGLPEFAAGVAGGILALVAVTRRHERSISVVLAIVPLVLVALFVLAELLIGHS